MTFRYSMIPMIVVGVLIVGVMEITPLRKKSQVREIFMVCTLLTIGTIVLLSVVFGVRIPLTTAQISGVVKRMLGR